MKLMLFERYIGGTMLKATAVTLLVLVILLVFFGLMDQIPDVGKGRLQAAGCFPGFPAGGTALRV